MKKILGLFASGWFIALIGVVLLALLVWFGGPWVGIGPWHPWAGAVARLLTIVVIVVIWAICLQIAQLRARRKARQLAADVAGSDDKSNDKRGARRDPEEGADGGESVQLQQRFREAVQTLRKRRRGGRNLYTLPWYVVIGPPGSGKSTLVEHSGLHFPLSDRFGKDALRGIGGTRNCDWWFTDEAVFLDTAGRYTTQDSDRQADAGAWAEFLRLLRRYRKRRPINGVLVAMSVSDLMALDAEGLRQHVTAVRRRLDELGEQLRIRVPVYLVLTKCDLVAGFSEFFEDLDAEQRRQVWGASFPVAKTLDGSAAASLTAEYDLLVERLQARVLGRLHDERDPARRAAILSFPMQLGSLRDTLRQFVEGIFNVHQYGTPPLLRGVYLTSGTQQGTPIDRMMGAIARTFGLAPEQVPAAHARQRTFFVERLLTDVLFRESGFAGTDPHLERRKIVLQAAAWFGVLTVTALLVVGMVVSHGRNRAYLGRVQQAIDKYPAKADVVGADSDKTYFAQALQRLGAMRSVQDVAWQYREDVPWLMRFGLYQGGAVGSQVHTAYLRELNALLVPGVAMRFRHGLSASADDPQSLYYYLKGYLMLGQPAHRDADQLVALTNMEWRKIFPADPVLQKALTKQFAVLADDPQHLRTIGLDEDLVTRARSTLESADLATLVYGNLKLHESASSDPTLRLDKKLGLLADVFRRKSGTPMSQPIPALYTQPVFRREAHKGIAKAVQRFATDSWVFGGAQMDTVARARMQQRVLALYEQDYISYWQDLLDDMALAPVDDMQAASGVAAKLAGPSSPLKALLKLVAANTSDMLRAPAGAKESKAEAAGKKLAARKARQRATRSSLSRVLASAHTGGDDAEKAGKPGDAISANFRAIDKLTAGGAGKAPIDQTMAALGQLSKTLLTMTDFEDSAGKPNPQLLLAQQKVAQLPSPVSDWLAGLTSSSQALVAKGTKSALGKQFKQTVGDDCAAFTHDRFPFLSSSRQDIPLQNFSDLFGYGGSFDSYYKKTLAKLVDRSGSRWTWKSGPGAVSGPPGMLREMQQADRIKRMYFPNHADTPRVDFSLTRPELGPGIGKFEMVVDGQTYSYQPGGSTRMTMRWPGPKPGQVKVSAWDATGNLISSFTYHGDWAFFRALQAAHLKRQSKLRYVARFDFGGHVAKVTILAGSLHNPFLNKAIHGFRCGG